MNSIYNEAIERIQLPDYAVPAFVDRTKYYYGTKRAIDDYLASASEYDRQPGDRIRANVLGKQSTTQSEGQFIHKNIYGFPYTFEWDAVEAEHLWVECEDSFCRCVKLKFSCLWYSDSIFRVHVPVTNSWGLPGIIWFNQDIVGNRLYEIEKLFPSEEEFVRDMEHFDGKILPKAFFDDVLGDG